VQQAQSCTRTAARTRPKLPRCAHLAVVRSADLGLRAARGSNVLPPSGVSRLAHPPPGVPRSATASIARRLQGPDRDLSRATGARFAFLRSSSSYRGDRCRRRRPGRGPVGRRRVGAAHRGVRSLAPECARPPGAARCDWPAEHRQGRRPLSAGAYGAIARTEYTLARSPSVVVKKATRSFPAAASPW
jgi:hypothetical protein